MIEHNGLLIAPSAKDKGGHEAMETVRDAATFSALLSQEDGLQVALAYLNEGVAHRYTAI
jgi:hypothetical protein